LIPIYAFDADHASRFFARRKIARSGLRLHNIECNSAMRFERRVGLAPELVVAKAHERNCVLTRCLRINRRHCCAVRRLGAIRYRVPNIDLVSGVVYLLKCNLYAILLNLGRFRHNVFRSRERLCENLGRYRVNLLLR